MARVRDYKAEYWRPIAKALIRDTNFPIMYFQDEEDVLELHDVGGSGGAGWERLAKNLRYKNQIEDAYLNGDQSTAKRLWRERDTSFPEWFWYYHVYHS